MERTAPARTIGLVGATGVGVGAIVGGGILALAGAAFASTGPGAIAAFALNGIVAVLTALSFAEMSTAFPESGGTYTFAKKVLSVEAAFAVGWVVWFASIVAGVLYALGFAAYAVIALQQLWPIALVDPPGWLEGRALLLTFALGSTGVFTFGLMRKSGGGGQWTTVGKVVVFAILITSGLWALRGFSATTIRSQLHPFFPGGGTGLLQAMGYTFIALQGFDLIAAVAGEVRDPGRTLPRAMLLSLALALIIYLPLLFVVATAGTPPGQSIAALAAEAPESVVAVAVRNFLGAAGFWLVIVAALLSMLSGLQANLFAASRVAHAMARDRTLPPFLEGLHPERSTPVAAILTSAATLALLLFVLPDVSAAGAAASLIFLISFALAHGTAVLARQRGASGPFRVPGFPAVPVVGGLACISLAVFQGLAVPSAGIVASVWLGIGTILFIVLFAQRARVVDAGAEAFDPRLPRLRGRAPLVLVPIANPANAEVMVKVANALAAPGVGRVLLLSVVRAPPSWEPGEPPPQLLDTQSVLGNALTASFAAGLTPEALTTVSAEPWSEIGRVARLHRCESLLLGFSNLADPAMATEIEDLLGRVDSDVVVLRAPPAWDFAEARRILVAVAGLGGHDVLLARLLASLCRGGGREVTFLRVLPRTASPNEVREARRSLSRLAADQVPFPSRLEVVLSDSVSDELARHAAESDLAILGLKRLGRRRKLFGDIAPRLARESGCGVIMISRRG